MHGTERDIRHGAGVILKMPLNPKRRLRSLRLVMAMRECVVISCASACYGAAIARGRG